MKTWYLLKNPPNRKNKKFMVLSPDNKKVYFGARGMSDYTIHKDYKRMLRYVNRHKKRENWNDPYTAGFWAKHLLWSKPSLNEAKTFIKNKFNIKLVKLNKNYFPNTLSEKDRKKQLNSILKNINRPKIKSFKSIRSGWVVKFEKKYNIKITDSNWIAKNILKKKGQELIINKGIGAYYSSGSRPNQTSYSWAYARLASTILNGPARKYDMNIWKKYKV